MAYRRALRICRYKDVGADRTSLWWIGFWLTGEQVDHAKLLQSLARELKSLRRQHRSIAESNRWRNSTFKSFEDLEYLSKSGGGLTRLLKFLGLSPEELRELQVSLYDETAPLKPELMKALQEKVAGSPEPFSDDYNLAANFEVGFLDDTTNNPGGFLAQLSECDIKLVRAIFRQEIRAITINLGLLLYSEDWTGDDLFFPVKALQAYVVGFDPRPRLPLIFRILLGVSKDREAGLPAETRLQNIRNQNADATIVLRSAAKELPRPNFIEHLSRPHKRVIE